MKARLRIPTQDQFAFIEADAEGAPDELVAQYNELIVLTRQVGGLAAKEWNKALDGYLVKGEMELETYQSLSRAQEWMIQELKKANKRINYKNNKEDHE